MTINIFTTVQIEKKNKKKKNDSLRLRLARKEAGLTPEPLQYQHLKINNFGILNFLSVHVVQNSKIKIKPKRKNVLVVVIFMYV